MVPVGVIDALGVIVDVGVTVLVGVIVGVGVTVLVGVIDALGVIVDVGVFVGVGVIPKVTSIGLKELPIGLKLLLNIEINGILLFCYYPNSLSFYFFYPLNVIVIGKFFTNGLGESCVCVTPPVSDIKNALYVGWLNI